jgi:hypothetical protein
MLFPLANPSGTVWEIDSRVGGHRFLRHLTPSLHRNCSPIAAFRVCGRPQAGTVRIPPIFESPWFTDSSSCRTTILSHSDDNPMACRTLSSVAQHAAHIERINSLESKLGHHATIVCALALSSRSAPVWVNSFGPIAFCKTSAFLSWWWCILIIIGGPWLKDARKLSEIVDEMRIWGQKTGWPVESIANSLLNNLK